MLGCIPAEVVPTILKEKCGDLGMNDVMAVMAHQPNECIVGPILVAPLIEPTPFRTSTLAPLRASAPAFRKGIEKECFLLFLGEATVGMTGLDRGEEKLEEL